MSAGNFLVPAMKMENTKPTTNTRSAYGSLGDNWVVRRARKAKMVQRRLSNAFGVVQPSGRRRLEPADKTRERPAPTWMPFTTGVGITFVNHLSRPVMLKMKTMLDVVKPADIVSSMVNFLAIATAAIACMSQMG